ncbi:uncharacterized protein SOCE26_084990 [Sorangium cellulosum]|uniref:Uncharacterized protein n=1 Tax=Sorangium cellulosum TaxID=56 RepID=A0A2L0F5X0_SORCE|nr:hypothetical protein [Sorangium cellulosum]AUX46988.1 uncharacterized protein SOCE26_084990 [Sorangium cellulosum]
MPLRRRVFWSPVLLSFAIAASGGCNGIFGRDELDFEDAEGHGGGSTASGGPGGGGGATSCEPESTIACYTGPEQNKGVGNCVLGVQTCARDGSAYGACVGDVKPERDEDCRTAGDEDCDGKVCSDALWSALFGDAGPQLGDAVAVDASGNVIVATSFAGTFSIGGSELSAASIELLLAKLGPTGEPIWAKQLNLGSNPRVGGVVTDARGNIVVGASGDGVLDTGRGAVDAENLVIKLDPDGEILWARGFGGRSGFQAPRLAVFGGGQIVVGGRFSSSIPFEKITLTSAGLFDIFLVLLNGDGVDLQRASYGGAENEWINALAVDGSSAYITGYFSGSLALGSAVHPAPPEGKSGMFVASVDVVSNTSLRWSKAFYARDLLATSIAVHPQVGVFLAGTFGEPMRFDPTVAEELEPQGSESAYLVKLSTEGAHAFSRRFGDFDALNHSAVAVDADGHAVLAIEGVGTADFGGDPLSSSGSRDVFLGKLDPLGAHLWSKRFGDPAIQLLGGIAVGPSNQVALVGAVDGTINFGDRELTSAGDYDLGIAVFAP